MSRLGDNLPAPPPPNTFQSGVVLVTAGLIILIAGSMLIPTPKKG